MFGLVICFRVCMFGFVCLKCLVCVCVCACLFGSAVFHTKHTYVVLFLLVCVWVCVCVCGFVCRSVCVFARCRCRAKPVHFFVAADFAIVSVLLLLTFIESGMVRYPLGPWYTAAVPIPWVSTGFTLPLDHGCTKAGGDLAITFVAGCFTPHYCHTMLNQLIDHQPWCSPLILNVYQY